MITTEGEERGDTSSGMLGVIIREFGER